MSRKNKTYQTNRFLGKNKSVPQSSYAKYVGSPTLSEWVFPIYRGILEDCCFKMKDVGGTAFHIGRNLFATARHVLEQHEYYNHRKIGFPNQVEKGYVAVYEFEVVEEFEKIDMVILKCDEIMAPPLKPKAFHWAHHELKYFEIVRSMGYPKGYDIEKHFLDSRAFQGTKVGDKYYENEILSARCYELSFHCLKGLSGACLFDSSYRIHGMITGNSKQEGYVFKESEILHSGIKGTLRVDRAETMYIGLAVQKSEIFNTNSNYLGMTIHEYLISEKLHYCKC